MDVFGLWNEKNNTGGKRICKNKTKNLESGINISGRKNISRKSKKAEDVSSLRHLCPIFHPPELRWPARAKKVLLFAIKHQTLSFQTNLGCSIDPLWWGKAPCDSSSTHTYSMPTEYKRAIGEKTFDLDGQSSRRIGMWRWRRPSGLLRDAITMLPVLKPHLPLQHKRPSRGQVKRFNFKQLLFCTGTLEPKHLFVLPLPDRDLCGPFLWVQDKCLA